MFFGILVVKIYFVFCFVSNYVMFFVDWEINWVVVCDINCFVFDIRIVFIFLNKVLKKEWRNKIVNVLEIILKVLFLLLLVCIFGDLL